MKKIVLPILYVIASLSAISFAFFCHIHSAECIYSLNLTDVLLMCFLILCFIASAFFIIKLTWRKPRRLIHKIVICIMILAILEAFISNFEIIAQPTTPIINKQIDDFVAEKPIIYLYPKVETEVSVKLGNPENITCSYPEYGDGWDVLAEPNGDLIDNKDGLKLYSLYWEGKDFPNINEDCGFVVDKQDLAQFLEEKLTILGLNYKEREEFIVYWLPKLQENETNIKFLTSDEINAYMPLDIEPKPDSVIRVYMAYKGVDEGFSVREEELESPLRDGFVAVEWGGVELK